MERSYSIHVFISSNVFVLCIVIRDMQRCMYVLDLLALDFSLCITVFIVVIVVVDHGGSSRVKAADVACSRRCTNVVANLFAMRAWNSVGGVQQMCMDILFFLCMFNSVSV